MSRIGKKPVAVPSGVTATDENGMLVVKGPKGTLTMPMLDDVIYSIKEDEILNERALHAPERPRRLRLVGRLNTDALVRHVVTDLVAHLQLQRALGTLDRQDLAFGGGADACRQLDRPFTNARHQNTSASTSPPTFASRASASDSTPRGVDTMIVPRPLRMRGSSRAAE